MKVVLFNRFFYPDQSATAQIATDLAVHLAKRFEVHAVATSPHADYCATEVHAGVHIHRIATAAKRNSLVLKAFDYVLFYVAARRWAKRHLSSGDIAVVKTDPPMLGMVLGHALEKRGVRVVQWLQDLFPEIAIAYRIPGAGLRALLNLRNRWMGRADGVVVIGELMKQKVLDENVVNPERLHVITNWANGAQIFSLPRESNPLRGEWGLSTKFVVGYSGNLGRVHEFDTFLNAAELLNRSDENVEFLIIGAGPRLGEVKAAVRSRGLTNVQFRPLQERDSLLHSLCVPDVHLCILKPEFEGLVVPSKLYGILAAGRPCIFVGSCNGEISAVLRQGNCGFGVQVGDPKGLSEAIRCLSNDQSLVSEMGRRSRALFEAQFSFPLAAAKWEALISELHLQPVNRG